jgi:3-deoxy-7-phosphoheptulonate synthase / chorismate mutase
VSSDPDRVEELRARIGANDRAIVAAVNERLRLVAELWALKDERGVSRLDPERERRLLDELATANDGPLSDAGLERLVTEILSITKRELTQD